MTKRTRGSSFRMVRWLYRYLRRQSQLALAQSVLQRVALDRVAQEPHLRWRSFEPPNQTRAQQKLRPCRHLLEEPCSSPAVDDTKYEDFICSCIEGQPVSTSRTSPATLESACLGRLQSSSGEIEDVDQEWEVRKVIGKEYVDGVPHYLVEWCPTLEPQHSLRHAKELVDEFEVQLEARRVAKDGSKGLYLKMKRRVVAVPDLSRRQQKKKQQGRLRKQK